MAEAGSSGGTGGAAVLLCEGTQARRHASASASSRRNWYYERRLRIGCGCSIVTLIGGSTWHCRPWRVALRRASLTGSSKKSVIAQPACGRSAQNVLHDGLQSTVPHHEVRRQAEHRIRRAASLACPGWIWAAAVIMNAPSVAGAALLAWFVFTADGPALTTVAGVLFVLVLFWAFISTVDSWQVLRRFARRFSR
jgi:hypothetical protein